MSDQSGLSHLQVLFEAAMQDYEKKTGIVLAKHPLAEKLQNCNSVETVTAVFQEQTQAFSEFRGKDKVFKPLKNIVSVLHKLSAAADAIGLLVPHVQAVNTCLAVLLSTVKGAIDSYDALVDLLESIEHFLNRLDIYTKIPPTVAMTEMVVKILIEVLSALALVTKQIKDGKAKKLVKKFLGENDVEAITQRLDRLTQDEARITAVQTLEVVYGLVQNMTVVMDDGKASVDCVRDALETIQQVASDINKSKRDELEKSIRSWLSPPDPWKNHNIACKSRLRGSATWFVQSDSFSKWKVSEAAGSLLWVHGKPGAGKSVLSATIIDDIDVMRKAGLASLAFFYCDFREDQKRGLRGLLSSLLVQLCHQSDSYCDILTKFYSEHAKGSRDPSDDALAECLMKLLKLPGLAPVYLIVDALDECPNTSAVPSPREEVLNLIGGLIKSEISDLRICVTSRPETDIKDVLDSLIFRTVCLHDEKGQKKDIEDYIKSVINTNPKNKRWKAEDKQLVIEILTTKADGMFRWVYCQVVYICGLIPARIRHALAELPDTLDETYRRTLREINKAQWEIAHRLFQFIAVAHRPLSVEELAELLAFDFEAGPIPEFHEGWRLEDPVDAVLSTCSSMLAIVDGRYSLKNTFRYGKVIQFSHFSVKEYLTSARLAEASDITSRRYHISTTPAHTLAAQACLGILLHLDKDLITIDGLKNFPLVEYAAHHWVDHARLEDVSRNVEDGLKELFDPNKPHLAFCIQIRNLSPRTNLRPKKPPRGAPLHYAVLWGLYSVVEFLVIQRPQDVNSREFAKNATPLHLALEKGHGKIARFLLEHDADVTAHKTDEETPLHLALKRGQLEVAGMLIERGASMMTANEAGKTPFHLALQMGLKVTVMLIERGTDLTAQNNHGETLLHLALRYGQLEVSGMLIERGTDLTVRDETGETPLHVASQKGQLDITEMLIERGANVTVQGNFGETPLHLASRDGQVEVAGMLIERGAELTVQDDYGETPLHLASRDGQVQVAEMLIERGADVTAKNKDGDTPLHLSSEHGPVEFARMLIECGADMNVRNKAGETSLQVASLVGQLEVVGLFIERGADLTVQDEAGDTPLHNASGEGHLEVAVMLIERGADLIAQNEDGDTSLHVALQERQLEVAVMLIERGADVTVQDNLGETPLHVASRLGQLEVAGMLIECGADLMAQNKAGETSLHVTSRVGNLEIAGMFTERGADVTSQNNYGDTPLHVASRQGQVEVVRMLIERGADLTAQNKAGDTPLLDASRGWRLKVAGMLIERGANLTVQGRYGETPLHVASRDGRLELAVMLIERGADMKTQDNYGDTPLHAASRQGQVEVADMLIEHGADLTARNKDGHTSLHVSSLEAAGMLIERGADPTAQDNGGETPLHVASREGRVEVAVMLIERGADLAAQSSTGETPLHVSSRQGPLEVVGMLIDLGADVTAQNKDGLTSLHVASRLGRLNVADMLVERGADLSAQDKSGETPLHVASRLGRLKVAGMLIERGADLTVQDKDGDTPLHVASRGGRLEVAEMLIKGGADVTTQNKAGETPLHNALTKFRIEVSPRRRAKIARILLEHGADATIQDKSGSSSFDLVSSLWKHTEVDRVLLQYGANPGSREKMS